MLEQGFSADSADYDGRTALMLSAGKGHAGAAAVPCSQSYACAAARRQREACLVSRCRQTLAMYLLLHQRANRPRAPRVRLRAPPPARPAPLGGNGTHLKSARPCCARPRSRRRRWRRPRFLPPLYYPTLPPATRRRGGAAAGRGRGRGGARLPGRQRAAGRHKGRAPRGHRRAQRARHHVRAPPCALKPRARTAARSAARQRLRLPLGAPAGAPEGTWSVYSGVHAGTLGVLGTGLRQGSCVRAADCCVPRRDAAHASTCPCTRARPDMRRGVWEKPRSRLRQVRSVRQSITARADAWRGSAARAALTRAPAGWAFWARRRRAACAPACTRATWCCCATSCARASMSARRALPAAASPASCCARCVGTLCARIGERRGGLRRGCMCGGGACESVGCHCL
jgi:hypothetical protein